MPPTPPRLYQYALAITRDLNRHSITPVLYGSLAVWVLTGDCPEGVDDVDVLVPEAYMTEQWPLMCTIFRDAEYTHDPRYNHEFWKDGIRVSCDSIRRVELLSNVTLSPLDTHNVNGALFFLPTPLQLLRIYQGCLASRLVNGKLDKDVVRINHLVSSILKSQN